MNKTIIGIIIGVGVCGLGFTSYKTLDYSKKIDENKKVIESLEKNISDLEKKSNDLEKENKNLKENKEESKKETSSEDKEQAIAPKRETNNQTTKEPVVEKKQEPKQEVKKEKSLSEQWQDIYDSWNETKQRNYAQGIAIYPTQHEVDIYKQVTKNVDRSRGAALKHDAAMGLIKDN